MDKIYMLGQLFALLESVDAISAEAIPVVAVCPQKYIGQYTAKAMQAQEYKRIESEVARIMSRLSVEDIIDAPIGTEEQGKFFLGYYNQQGKKKRGAPLSDARIDWTTVDFSKGDSELARELGVARQTVRSQRMRHASERKA